MKEQRRLKGFVTPQKAQAQAATLANSVVKNFRHLARRFRRENVDCFRLYDWDSPDIRIVIDWYAGRLVVAEYERKQTTDEYLPQMAAAAAAALNVPPENIYLKRRRTKTQDGPRYKKLADSNERFVVNERALKFWVNLKDFLDTGLYSDHRETRKIIAETAGGKRFLNLFAYTGAFTCAAARAGAKGSVTVDRSDTYLEWARDNLVLNGLAGERHQLVQNDVFRYLDLAARQGAAFDLIVADPPSFFQDNRAGIDFDILRDHPGLLARVLKVASPGADIFFSTNHQRFRPHFEELKVKEIIPLTPQTIPPDYRNKNIHNCWQIRV